MLEKVYIMPQVVTKQLSTSTKYFEVVHEHLFLCWKSYEMHWRGSIGREEDQT